jgi:hypothetical protein
LASGATSSISGADGFDEVPWLIELGHQADRDPMRVTGAVKIGTEGELTRRTIRNGFLTLLPLTSAGAAWAGEIVDYSRPPPRFGAVPKETHHIRNGAIRIDKRIEKGTPKVALLLQRYTRPGQPFAFKTVRSQSGRLLGVHAMDDPFDSPPSQDLRHETGQAEIHLGLECRTWKAVRTTSGQHAFVQSGCTTPQGIELWFKQANIDTITADSVRQADVTAEDVRLPIETLDTAALMREKVGSDHRGDYEVVLEGDGRNRAIYRKSGNWRYVEEQGGGYTRIAIENDSTGVNISYSREKDGTRRLGWSRPPYGQNPPRLQFRGASLAGAPSQSILGERCSMRDMMPGVMDAGRTDCLTSDDIPLASARSSWGSGYALRAVRLSRKPQALTKVSLARYVTDATGWRVDGASASDSTGQVKPTS